AMALGHVAELGDGCDVAVHGIDALEGDELGAARVAAGEPALEIGGVVMREDLLLGAAVTDALDHRGMVERVGEDHAARHLARQGRERRLVGDVARSEGERRFLAMQIGELAFEQHVIMSGAGDVARAASPGAHAVDRLMHRGEHLGMLAHAEIVVGAPDRDLGAEVVAEGAGKGPGTALEIGEDPIASFGAQRVGPGPEKSLVVHGLPRIFCEPAGAQATGASPARSSAAAVSSSALPKRRSISSVSSAVMMSGGQSATVSPMARRISPCSCARAAKMAPTPALGSKGAFVALSLTSSMPARRPTPRTSPTSGWA